jgi:hypothetical protein
MKYPLIGFCLLFPASLVYADTPGATNNAPPPPLAISLTDMNAQAIYGLLAGVTPGHDSQAHFSGGKIVPGNMAANVFVKNPKNWAASVDLTCISVYNDRPDGYGTKFQTTAISPRHGIGPAHTSANIGTHYNWLASDGTTVTRTIIGKTNAANDVEIYLFDSDLPATVTPARMLPPTWARFLDAPVEPTNKTIRICIPVIMPTQEACIYCNEAFLIALNPAPQIFFRVPTTQLGLAFSNIKNGHNGLWSGDSGDTAGMLINGGYVPIVEWHFGGAGGSGPFLPGYYSEINAAMHKLSADAHLTSDYQITPVDLTNFSEINK